MGASRSNSWISKTIRSNGKLHHQDVMATKRRRTTGQRAMLWFTALSSFAIGAIVYLVTEQRPAFLEPLAFKFEELPPEITGIDFIHEKGDFAPLFDNVRPWIQTISASTCVNDVDRDGLIDIYLVNSGPNSSNKLFRNMGSFRFNAQHAPTIEDLNRDGEGFSTDCLFADVNNDGYDDLLVTAMSHAPRLFLNLPASETELGRRFEDVSDSSGLPDYLNSYTATFVDIENDGDLDLIIGGTYPTRYSPELVAGSPYIHNINVPDAKGASKIFPNSLGKSTNGGTKHLLLNDGNGKFSEQDIEKWGIARTRRFTLDIGTGDINRDGYTDLYFANDFGADDLYLNDRGKSFVHVLGTFPTDVGRDSYKGMDAEFYDINNDGYPEIYVSNVFHPLLPEGNMLWLNQTGDSEDKMKPKFKNVATQMGVQDGGWAWGGKFADLDLDTDPDLVVTNGMISQNPDRNYWFALTRLAGGSGEIISDTTKLPPIKDMSLSGFETTRVFIRHGGRYYDRADDVGITHDFDGRGVALADFDLDGRIDLLIAPQGGRPLLAKNAITPSDDGSSHAAFVGFKLAGDGVRVNRNAVGSRVKISPSNVNDDNSFLPQYYEINAGNGFAAQSMYWIHAGLGEYTGKVNVEIWWTDGRKDRLGNLALNQYHEIAYGEVEQLVSLETSAKINVGEK